jgi:hypothetical protein
MRASVVAQAGEAIRRARGTLQRAHFLITYWRALLDQPKRTIRGGDDTPPAERTIRERIRELIYAGLLPRFSSGRMLAAPCVAERHCTVCGGWINVGELDVEIVSRTGVAVIHLHRPCLDLWTEEASEGQGPPSA